MTWAPISPDERDGLNVALNEATWAAIDVDVAARRVRLLFDVLSLPPDGAASAGSRVIIAVSQVSRIAASLRMGWWNDQAAAVVPLQVADLDATVRSFGGSAIYGWEFIDPPEKSWLHWRDRLSADVRLHPSQSPHVIDLFQEGGSAQPRHLDLRIWFALIQITTPGGRDIRLPEFIASGVRWWDGLYSGDPRTSGQGIVPLAEDLAGLGQAGALAVLAVLDRGVAGVIRGRRCGRAPCRPHRGPSAAPVVLVRDSGDFPVGTAISDPLVGQHGAPCQGGRSQRPQGR